MSVWVWMLVLVWVWVWVWVWVRVWGAISGDHVATQGSWYPNNTGKAPEHC